MWSLNLLTISKDGNEQDARPLPTKSKFSMHNARCHAVAIARDANGVGDCQHLTPGCFNRSHCLSSTWQFDSNECRCTSGSRRYSATNCSFDTLTVGIPRRSMTPADLATWQGRLRKVARTEEHLITITEHLDFGARNYLNSVCNSIRATFRSAAIPTYLRSRVCVFVCVCNRPSRLHTRHSRCDVFLAGSRLVAKELVVFFYDPRVRQHLQQSSGELHERRELWIKASTLEEHKEDTHWRLASPEQLLQKKPHGVVTTGLVLG